MVNKHTALISILALFALTEAQSREIIGAKELYRDCSWYLDISTELTAMENRLESEIASDYDRAEFGLALGCPTYFQGMLDLASSMDDGTPNSAPFCRPADTRIDRIVIEYVDFIKDKGYENTLRRVAPVAKEFFIERFPCDD